MPHIDTASVFSIVNAFDGWRPVMEFQTRTKPVYSDSEYRATLCACSRSARFTFRM